MKRVLLVAATVGLWVSAQAQQAAPQIDSIRQADMRADLFFLGGDAMRGRLTDTVENRLAAEFIASRFERMGLTPIGPSGSWYQPYDLITATLGDANSLDVIKGAERQAAKDGVDFYPQRFSATGRAEGGLAFVGYGISWPEINHNDYRGDVKGKIVIAIDHEPGEADPASAFDGVVTAEASSALKKALAAQDAGAAGILFVSDVHNHPTGAINVENASRAAWPAKPPRIERYMLGSWVERLRIPAAQISPAFAATLLAGTNRTLVDIAKGADVPGGAPPLVLPDVQLSMATAVNRRVIADRNVVGFLEGADPKLKDEIVIVCAHYDHDGADGTRILNGADDDGSGTIGVIEIAEAYALAAKAGRRPKRSLLFAAWNSEERGLLGAWAYTEQPLRPLDKIVAVLNMDMIGRNEEVPEGGGGRFRGLDVQTAESNANAVNVIGTLRSKQMKAETEKANEGIALDLRFRYDNNISNLMRRSDHWPFLNRGVPGLWFHTGLHPDYHTDGDRPERINYVKMEKVARLVYQMSWNLADQPGRPKLDPR